MPLRDGYATLDLVGTVELVEAFDPRDDDRATRGKQRVMTLLQSHLAPFDRTTYRPGHITASGVVMCPDRMNVILVFHRRLGRWLQPGGHIEPTDRTVCGAAQREIREETGVDVTTARYLGLVSIDVHDIPAASGEPFHQHHDLMFGFLIDTRNQQLDGHNVIWCGLHELDRFQVDAPLRNAFARALRPAG